MSLRDVSAIGLPDPLSLSGPLPATEPHDDQASSPPTLSASPAGGAATERPGNGDGLPAGAPRPAARRRRRRAAPVVPLADQQAEFVQILVPADLRDQLEDASWELKKTNRKLHHQKTIVGALLWRHVGGVDYEDPEQLEPLGALLREWEEDPLSEISGDRKLGWHLPGSLKEQLDGCARMLRRTHDGASAKAVLSALIRRYVDVDDRGRYDELVELLKAYRAELRPRTTPAADAAEHAVRIVP